MGTMECEKTGTLNIGQLLQQSGSYNPSEYATDLGDYEVLPKKATFPVTLLGFDDLNFAYVGCISSKHDKWMHQLCTLMSASKDKVPLVSYNDYKVGKKVMLKIPCGDSEGFYRAKILTVPVAPGQRVECLRVDSYSKYDAHPKSIFELPESVATTPELAVRCHIDGLQFFHGLDVFNWKENQRIIFRRGTRSDIFMATKVGKSQDGTPVLKLVGEDGKSLVSKVQALIQSACEFEMVETTLSYMEYRQVSFTFVDDKCKYIWLQPLINPIMDRIKEVLNLYKPEENGNPNNSTCQGQEIFLTEEEQSYGKRAVYVTKFDDIWYRTCISQLIENENQDEEQLVELQYIDFGGTAVIPKSSLISASQVDENLCFIPPQILKAKINKEGDPTLRAFFTEMIKKDAILWVKNAVRSIARKSPVVDVLIPEGFFSDMPHNPVPIGSEDSGIYSIPSTEDIVLLQIKDLIEKEQAANQISEDDEYTIENLCQSNDGTLSAHQPEGPTHETSFEGETEASSATLLSPICNTSSSDETEALKNGTLSAELNDTSKYSLHELSLTLSADQPEITTDKTLSPDQTEASANESTSPGGTLLSSTSSSSSEQPDTSAPRYIKLPLSFRMRQSQKNIMSRVWN